MTSIGFFVIVVCLFLFFGAVGLLISWFLERPSESKWESYLGSDCKKYWRKK